MRYSCRKLYEISKEREGSVKSLYRRGTYRISSVDGGDYRAQVGKTMLIRTLEQYASVGNQRDRPNSYRIKMGNIRLPHATPLIYGCLMLHCYHI